MKGGLVSMLFAVRALSAIPGALDGQVLYSLVPDEETGGHAGTAALWETGEMPRSSLGMLMPEPTGGVVWNANKGALTYRFTVRGRAAHVGLESQGVNAFEHMVELARDLFGLRQEVMARSTSMPVRPPQGKRSAMLIGGEFSGGVNFNVVPDRVSFTLDRRLNPEERPEDAKAEIMRVVDEHRARGMQIDVELLQEGEPSVAKEGPLHRALRESVAAVTGAEPAFELCPGLCEIRFFTSRDIPAFAYGPGILEISHGPEEFVRLQDVGNCALVYARTALRLLAKSAQT
jgi:acetylornithine deacetylase/succinyl-diaminopimelate desuccinylase-like protein